MIVRARPETEASDPLERNPGLTDQSLYYVIGLDNTTFRIIDDLGRPVLYSKEFFEIIDDRVPRGWVFRHYPEGEYRLSPYSCAMPGFFEKVFGADGDTVAEQRAWSVLEHTLEEAVADAPEQSRQVIESGLERLRKYLTSRAARRRR